MSDWPFYWLARPVAISTSDGLIRVGAMFAMHAANIEDAICESPDSLERRNLAMRASWLRTIAQEMALGMFDDAWKHFVKCDLVKFRESVVKIQKKQNERHEAKDKP